MMVVLAVEPEPGRRHLVPGFDEIYAQHFAFVWRSLRRLGVPNAVLDDASQEVFLVVHRRLSEFEGRAQLRTWLFSIVLRVAQRTFRTRARLRTCELDEEHAAAPGSSPQDQAVRNETVERVYAILDRLTPEKRAVFVMAELEQFTAPEIARMTGTPLNTVYARLRAARRDFETALERDRAKDRWRMP